MVQDIICPLINSVVSAYLTNERDLWESTSYNLAVKVAKKSELNNIQQLQLSGKTWQKLAIHYTIVLADQDTKQV